MAFLRKHRDRYWLVHNFREGSKVRQVRIYSFDLHADLEQEMARAQQAAAALSAVPLSGAWLDPVRQGLQRLYEDNHRQHWEQHMAQARQHLDSLVSALERLAGTPASQHQMLCECLERLQQMPLDERVASVQTRAVAPPRAPAHEPIPLQNTPAQEMLIAPGLYGLGQSLHHQCLPALPETSLPDIQPLDVCFIHTPPVLQAFPGSAGVSPASGAGKMPALPGVSGLAKDLRNGHLAPPSQPLAPVFRVALHQGRDLWLECNVCHERWTDLSLLTRFPTLSLPCRRITRFERFCQEHHIGDACYILMRYGSGHIERLQGTLTMIDYPRQNAQVTVPHRHVSRTYWRHFASVYFGTLEVRLTPAQHARLLAGGGSTPVALWQQWYSVEDTPGMRVLLRQCRVSY